MWWKVKVKAQHGASRGNHNLCHKHKCVLLLWGWGTLQVFSLSWGTCSELCHSSNAISITPDSFVAVCPQRIIRSCRCCIPSSFFLLMSSPLSSIYGFFFSPTPDSFSWRPYYCAGWSWVWLAAASWLMMGRTGRKRLPERRASRCFTSVPWGPGSDRPRPSYQTLGMLGRGSSVLVWRLSSLPTEPLICSGPRSRWHVDDPWTVTYNPKGSLQIVIWTLWL